VQWAFHQVQWIEDLLVNIWDAVLFYGCMEKVDQPFDSKLA
jgi:hypothetical protein